MPPSTRSFLHAIDKLAPTPKAVTQVTRTMPLLPCEGVFAINKTTPISSAQVIRDAQSAFKDSAFFQPWFTRERQRRDDESHNQRQKRRSWKQRQPLQLKMGHGGTLDPMARGVLILGVGNGTKAMGKFQSECTKSYEAVVLFGVATDSYDAVGKVVGRSMWEGVTKEKVEAALEGFRGKIMQKPPIFSALKVKGKKLYEYARAGEEVPIEILERPVEVEELEIVEWMDGGAHQWAWPEEEAGGEEKKVAEKVLHLGDKRGIEAVNDKDEAGHAKRAKMEPRAADDIKAEDPKPTTASPNPCPAPACRLRMTVTSGFYVRSLCHDLGAAVGSLAIMSDLVRTRQGDFEIGKNVLEYDDLERGEAVWEPQVEKMLEEWQTKEREAAREESEDETSVPRRKQASNDKHRSRRGRGGDGREEEIRRRNSSSDDD